MAASLFSVRSTSEHSVGENYSKAPKDSNVECEGAESFLQGQNLSFQMQVDLKSEKCKLWNIDFYMMEKKEVKSWAAPLPVCIP